MVVLTDYRSTELLSLMSRLYIDYRPAVTSNTIAMAGSAITVNKEKCMGHTVDLSQALSTILKGL